MYRSRIDRWTATLLGGMAAISCAIVGLIVLFLAVQSWPAIDALGLRLLTDSSWRPASARSGAEFGMGPIVVGALAVTFGSVLIAAPLGLASAIFRRFYAPSRLSTVYLRLVELLSGVPSVVFGLWGLVVLAPRIARLHPPGPSLLAGVFVVGLMILPTIMLVADSAIGAVPRATLQAAAALGMGRWTIIRQVVLPAARRGIATGVVLGAARAMGETMAVVMVCGNVIQVPGSLFDPVRTLTANIALEMGYALGIHRSALFVSGFLLMLIAFCLVWLTHRLQRDRPVGRVDLPEGASA